MKELLGVLLIALLWFNSADFIREYPFELKLPSMILMGFLTLVIAYFTNLTDKLKCKE